MWYTYILNMRFVQASLLEISCLKGFHNLTPVDPKWPLTSTKNNRLLVLNVVHLHIKYEICPSFPSWDIVFTRFSQFDPLTPNDLWPPPKTMGFLYPMWYTYIPNMRSVQDSLHVITCLQGFHNLTPVDPKWHLTSTKTNRLLVLNSGTPTYQIWDLSKFPFLRYHVYKVFRQFDPCWPQMTLWHSIQKQYSFLYSHAVHLHTQIMRSVQASLLEIMCLQNQK